MLKETGGEDLLGGRKGQAAGGGYFLLRATVLQMLIPEAAS